MTGQSIKSQVYEGILNDIMDGVYDVHSVITEKDMIEKYGVSKTPVREALVQLCGEGTLRNIPRFGYQLVAITPPQILEVIEYRKIIEVGALKKSFEEMTPEMLEELRELNRMAEEIEMIHDYKLHWKCNQEFHRKLCSFCKNSYLQKALDDSLNIFTRISNQYYTAAWSKNRETKADNHCSLIKALENQNLEEAARIICEDIEAFKGEII